MSLWRGQTDTKNIVIQDDDDDDDWDTDADFVVSNYLRSYLFLFNAVVFTAVAL